MINLSLLSKGPFLKSLGQNIGLLVGAVFWGVGSDIWGRRYHSTAPSKISRHDATSIILGCPSTLRSSSPAFLPYLVELRQTQLRSVPSRRCGALEWGVTFPSTLLSFWVCQVPQLAYLGSPVDCLWDFNYRIYTSDTPISTDSFVCLVGSGATSW